MRVGVFFLAGLFGVFAAAAQTRVDSLQRVLAAAQGTVRVDVLNELTYEYIGTDNARALTSSEQALALAQQLEYERGIGVAYIYRGVYEYLSGENTRGIDYLKKGLPWVVKVKDRDMEGYAHLQLGNSFMNITAFDSSLVHYDLAYQLMKDSANPVNLSKLYKNMATLYGLKSSYDKQEYYLDKALAIREKLGDRVLVADALVEMGRLNAANSNFDKAQTYLDRAWVVLEQNPADLENLNDYRYARALVLLHDTRFEEAFSLLDSAKNFYERTSMLMKMVTLHIDLGAVFMARGEYEVALKNYYAALRFADGKGFLVQVMDIQARLGWVNYMLGEYQQALELGQQSLQLATEKNVTDRMANACLLLGVTHIDQRNFEVAERFLTEALNIRLRTKDPTLISEGYMNLGYLKEVQKDFSRALGFYQQALAYGQQSDYWLGLAWATLGLGKISAQEGAHTRAMRLYEEAEAYAGKVSANEVLIRLYVARRDLLATLGRYKEALHYSMRAEKLKDSLHRDDLARRFTNLQKIDEIERRDRDIKALEQERLQAQAKIDYQQAVLNQQYILIGAAVVAVVLLSVIAMVYARFYFKIKRLHALIKEKNSSIQLQADKLREANDELGKLYREVTEQKEEIQAQSEELTESYDHISTMNASLQILVDEKTRDLLKTNEELIKQNNELLQFSYTVSHNLRGPVARLLGLSDLMVAPATPEEREMFVQLIHKTSKDLDNVMRDLSKIIDVRNELHTVKEQVDLELEWKKCCDLVRELIPPEARVEVNFELKEIFTIRAMVHSIFYNLLSNAIKYKSPKRDLLVKVNTRQEGDNMRLEFEDNGLGIDLPKYQGSLFRLFKRFHTHVEGRGLGLYLIKSQIESLNGTIDVASKVDQGTRFTILIPGVTVAGREVHTADVQATQK